MYKKIKFYCVILTFLWLGAITQVLAETKLNHLTLIDAYTEKTTSLLKENTLEGKINFNQGKNYAKKIIKQYQGNVIKEIKGENFYSFYGYSKLLPYFITVENQKINLNVVFTYNEKTKKTTVKVATPFLNEDY